jgi:hypothetical protein
MSEYHTPFEKHLSQITQAEFVADAPQQHQTDDIRWILQTVEE